MVLAKKPVRGPLRRRSAVSYSQERWREVVDGFEHDVRHDRLFGAERETIERLRANARVVWDRLAYRCKDDEEARALIAAILSAGRWALEAPSQIEHSERTTRGWRRAREGAETLREFLQTIRFVHDSRQG
jgi:hypothetical protein